MNFKSRSLALLLLAFCLFAADSYGQTRKKKSDVDQYFDESGSIATRLWYGGGFNLGFSGTSGFSAFSLGISPMVGYKVFENNSNFSVGPRANLDYSYYKGTGTDNQIHSVQSISYSLGLFARYKVFSNFFAHAEVEQENRESIAMVSNLFVIGTDGKPLTQRDPRQNLYLGAGYTSGGVLAYEVLIIYNALEPSNSVNLPFDIRFGFTYKF